MSSLSGQPISVAVAHLSFLQAQAGTLEATLLTALRCEGVDLKSRLSHEKRTSIQCAAVQLACVCALPCVQVHRPLLNIEWIANSASSMSFCNRGIKPTTRSMGGQC